MIWTFPGSLFFSARGGAASWYVTYSCWLTYAYRPAHATGPRPQSRLAGQRRRADRGPRPESLAFRCPPSVVRASMTRVVVQRNGPFGPYEPAAGYFDTDPWLTHEWRLTPRRSIPRHTHRTCGVSEHRPGVGLAQRKRLLTIGDGNETLPGWRLMIIDDFHNAGTLGSLRRSSNRDAGANMWKLRIRC
jgi:hypothetical protein